MKALFLVVLALAFPSVGAATNINPEVIDDGGVSTGYCQAPWGTWYPHGSLVYFDGRYNYCGYGRWI